MIPCQPKLRERLIRVAQQQEAPDLLLQGGSVWSPFTGAAHVADVAVCADRIALVALWQGALGTATLVEDVSGCVLVPGYVEPHTHPWPYLNPLSLAEGAVCRGTTALVLDTLLYALSLGPERLGGLCASLSHHAFPHLFWFARMASQSRFPGEEEVFSEESVAALLARPEFLATGEMTRWTDFLDPGHASRLLQVVERARGMGRYVDGHTAGASARRLPALAAAGLHSCHEAITAEEALERLRQGLWVLLRNSSLRQDLSALLPVLEHTAFSDRMAFTTDGAKAHHLAEYGHLDHLIRLALDAGVDVGVAYRMATLNAATCIGLGDDLGAVAPGRVADVNVLGSLRDPTPRAVVCRGKLVARHGRLLAEPPSERFAWSSAFAGSEPRIPLWQKELFPLPRTSPAPFPAGKLVNAVITRKEPVSLRDEGDGLWPDAEDALVLALGDRSGAWIGRGVITNMARNLEALASTYTTNGGFVVLGRTPRSMANALSLLRRLGSGTVVQPCGTEPRGFPLPVAGIHMAGGFADAAGASKELQRVLGECGYSHADPNYTLLFLSCDFLPDLRLTRAGWTSVKDNALLLPSAPVRGRNAPA